MKRYTKIFSWILMLVLLATTLTGCGEIKRAESVVHNAFTALKALDFEGAATYLNIDEIINEDNSEDALSVDENLFMESIFGKLEYEILSSEKIDSNTVVVKTNITAIDMKPVLTDYFTKALQFAFANAFSSSYSEEETSKKMEEMFLECVSKEDLAMVSNEVDIKVVKVDNKWKIASGDTLSNALLGGLTQAVEDLSNVFTIEE